MRRAPPAESGSQKVNCSGEMAVSGGFKYGYGGFKVLYHAYLPVLSGNRSGAGHPTDRYGRRRGTRGRSLATELDLSSTQSSRRDDAREDALRPCLTYRTLLPTTLADTDATCSRCLTLRGEGTRRVTTIPEISPLAQSFPSVVRLQCLDLTRYLSNT